MEGPLVQADHLTIIHPARTAGELWISQKVNKKIILAKQDLIDT